MISDTKFYKKSYLMFTHYIITERVVDKPILDAQFWEKALEKINCTISKEALKILRLVLPVKDITSDTLLNLLFTVSCRSSASFNLLLNNPDKWGAMLIWPYSEKSLVIVSEWVTAKELARLKEGLRLSIYVEEWNLMNVYELRLKYPKTFNKFSKYY